MAKPTEKTYDATPRRLYDAALKAAASLGYSVSYTDNDSLILSFKTGMSMRSWSGQAMSASIFAEGNGAKLLLTGGLAKKGTVVTGGQLVSWGEKGAITRRFLETVDRVLPETPEAASSVRGGAADELERLADLHSKGALSDDEFAAAKARALS